MAWSRTQYMFYLSFILGVLGLLTQLLTQFGMTAREYDPWYETGFLGYHGRKHINDAFWKHEYAEENHEEFVNAPFALSQYVQGMWTTEGYGNSGWLYGDDRNYVGALWHWTHLSGFQYFGLYWFGLVLALTGGVLTYWQYKDYWKEVGGHITFLSNAKNQSFLICIVYFLATLTTLFMLFASPVLGDAMLNRKVWMYFYNSDADSYEQGDTLGPGPEVFKANYRAAYDQYGDCEPAYEDHGEIDDLGKYIAISAEATLTGSGGCGQDEYLNWEDARISQAIDSATTAAQEYMSSACCSFEYTKGCLGLRLVFHIAVLIVCVLCFVNHFLEGSGILTKAGAYVPPPPPVAAPPGAASSGGNSTAAAAPAAAGPAAGPDEDFQLGDAFEANAVFGDIANNDVGGRGSIVAAGGVDDSDDE